MMSLRFIVALATFALQLCGCAVTTGKPSAADQGIDRPSNATIQELEWRHAATTLTTGVGGGGM